MIYRKNIFLIISVLFYLPLALNAMITFEKVYKEEELKNQGIPVQQTKDGGYVVIGSTWFSELIWLIKIDSLGDTSWTKSFHNPFPMMGSTITSEGIIQTADNGYIIIGGLGYGDVAGGVIIKTDSLGDTLWIRGYYFVIWDIQKTMDDGYILTGCDCYNDYPALCKIDSTGVIVWGKFFYNSTPAGGAGGYAGSVQQLSDGGYVICGTIEDSTYHRFAFLIRTDSLGDSLWGKTYMRGGFSEVQETTDKNYILTGVTLSQVTNKPKVLLVKADSLGDTLWTKIFGGDSSDGGASVKQTKDGGFIISGYTCSFGVGKADVYLIKTDSSGDTCWTRTFGGTGGESGSSVQQTMDGGYIVAGPTNSFGSDTPLFYDIYLIKTDSLGCIAVEEIEPIETDYNLSLLETPFVKSTIFKYDLLIETTVSLNIYNVSGTLVKTLINEQKQPGNYSVDFNAKGLPTGIYFARFKAGKYQTTRKMIFIK